MATIFDYLLWRGDVPFSTDPFNEVDNLVLAELSYTDFAGVVPADGTEVPLQEAYKNFFRMHTLEEILSKTTYTARVPLLMQEMAAGARFGTTRVSGYINEVDKEKEAQVSAVTFLLPDGTAYVAFRGTDNTVVGWREDMDLSYTSRTEGQMRAVEYLNEVGRRIDRPLRVGGHSKGGNFAAFAASLCDENIQERILKVYSNDGPGFREDILQEEGYQRIVPRMISIIPDTSVIGKLLHHDCKVHIVESSANGLVQHDALTWQVIRNHFVTAEISRLGNYIDVVLDDWTAKLDDETRKSLVESIFTLFDATGKDTIAEMSGQKLKSFEAMLSTIRRLPKDKQVQLLSMVKELVLSGADNLGAFTKKLFAAD